MAVWVARGGRQGERDARMVELCVCSIGWDELRDQDLTSVSREKLAALIRERYPDAKALAVAAYAGQLWSFVGKMQVGDLLVLPLKYKAYMAIGKITSPYKYRTDLEDDMRHTHDLQWIKTDVPRTAFKQDLQYAFGAFRTVFQVSRNDAEQRVQEVLQRGLDPGPTPGPVPDEGTSEVAPVDLAEMALNQIETAIGTIFKGHSLARLVDGILQAQGYFTRLSPPGPDRGVDILAGSGRMGFDYPRLCVQVKSGDSRVDLPVYQALKGTMQSFSAEQGLLVSWGGFTPPVEKEAASSFFAIRLWGRTELVTALLDNYDRLPKDIQAELPLKQTWVIVKGDEEEVS